MPRIYYLLLLTLTFAACSGTKSASSAEPSKEPAADPYSLSVTSFEVEGDTAFIQARSEYIKGITEFELGNYNEAVDHLLSAYIKMPNEAGVNYALADAYLNIRDFDNATYYGLEAINIDPENKFYRIKMAEIYGAVGNLDGTIDQLRKAADTNPGDVELLYLLANTLNRQSKLMEANEVYDRILKYTGDDLQVLYKKFKNFDDLGLQDSAIVTLERMKAVDPSNVATLNTLSRYYLNQGETGPAKTNMKQALTLDPEDTQTLVNLADLYISEAKWDSATTLMISIVEDTLTAAQNKLELVQYMFSKLSQDSGNAELKKATGRMINAFLDNEPEFPMGYALAADYYIQIGDVENALVALERTTDLMPQNDNAWRTRVQFLYTSGNYDETIAVGKQADGIFPDDPFMQFFVGAAYFLKNDYQKALTWLENSTRAPSEKSFRSVIFGLMGDVYNEMDNWDKAVEVYEKALELNPDNENVLNNYAYYLSERDEQLERAKKMSLRAIEIVPGNAAYLDTVGWVFYKLKDFENARKYIQKSIDTGEASSTVYEHLGDVYQQLGDLTKAREWWKRAYENDQSKEYLLEKMAGES